MSEATEQATAQETPVSTPIQAWEQTFPEEVVAKFPWLKVKPCHDIANRTYFAFLSSKGKTIKMYQPDEIDAMLAENLKGGPRLLTTYNGILQVARSSNETYQGQPVYKVHGYRLKNARPFLHISHSEVTGAYRVGVTFVNQDENGEWADVPHNHLLGVSLRANTATNELFVGGTSLPGYVETVILDTAGKPIRLSNNRAKTELIFAPKTWHGHYLSDIEEPNKAITTAVGILLRNFIKKDDGSPWLGEVIIEDRDAARQRRDDARASSTSAAQAAVVQQMTNQQNSEKQLVSAGGGVAKPKQEDSEEMDPFEF